MKDKDSFSKEEILEAILEVKLLEHHGLSEDWDVELTNILFNENKEG